MDVSPSFLGYSTNIIEAPVTGIEFYVMSTFGELRGWLGAGKLPQSQVIPCYSKLR